MRSQVFIPDARSLVVDRVCFDDEKSRVEVTVHSSNKNAECPLCGQQSARTHSYYNRRLADLPWQGFHVVLVWRSRKFFCCFEDCERKVFVERLPKVARPYGRRTERMSLAVRCIAIACGGEGGCRLAQRLGMNFSPDTLLRETRRVPVPNARTPRVLGVDDWAFRKGQRYGTVLVDLEGKCPVDLLPDRESESLAAWLQEHPGVEIISRDRGDCYIKGATDGAPKATQVADRFHLMQNLREALGRLVDRHSKQVRAIAKRLNESSEEFNASCDETRDAPTVSDQNELSDSQGPSSNRRRERYDEVMELHTQGTSQREIARRLGIHRSTVRIYIESEGCPERATRKYSSHADACASYLWSRWKQGCRNAKQLTQEIQAQGFNASYYSVRRRVSQWRGKESNESNPPVPRPKAVSPKQVSWLLIKDETKLSNVDKTLKSLIFDQCPEIEVGCRIASGFRDLFKRKVGHEIEGWLDHAMDTTSPKELRSFAKGVKRDASAIVAAITLPWSNGQTEGQVNRLKTLKRQMYGRGAFDLLRVRFLGAS